MRALATSSGTVPVVDVPHLVAVGTPSQDRIEIGGRVHDTVGGSGFITAVAARVSGVASGIVARVPERLPPPIARAFGPGMVDPGGLVVTGGDLPSFEIRYDATQQADYLTSRMGDEPGLVADDVPRRWLQARWIHIAPIGASAAVQDRFIRGLLRRGWEGGLSVGTFVGEARRDPATVRELFAVADVAFCNAAEAALLFDGAPPPGTTIVVTRGPEGVDVWDGAEWRHRAAAGVDVVDPTGAGDAFCGGYLAGLLRGEDPIAVGMARAAEILTGPGAAPLLNRLAPRIEPTPPAPAPATEMARPVPPRIGPIAARLADVAGNAALDFAGDGFPPAGSAHALDTLAVATLHQYGFWTGDDHGYVSPMWTPVGGRRRKGSDVIWERFTRTVAADPSVVDPDRLATDPLLFDRICTDDTGICPVPDAGSHRLLQQAYGRYIGRRGGIATVVAEANRSPDPVATFVARLGEVPGFREDPLAKKARLLALILRNRPERFLVAGTEPGPIIDYHLMRVCLRSHCVEIDDELRPVLVDRAWVDAATEATIRLACHDAVAELAERSGLPMGAVDGFLFTTARSHCLEMDDLRCGACPLAGICARDVDLFQPVFRTTAY